MKQQPHPRDTIVSSPGCAPQRSYIEDLRHAWWWLDEAKRRAYELNPVAWQWELLRRTLAYRSFFAELMAYEAGTTRNPPVLADHLGSDDPCRRWPVLRNANCVPNLDWGALPERSRKVLECNAPLFTRADILTAFVAELEIDAVIVTCQDGAENLRPPAPAR